MDPIVYLYVYIERPALVVQSLVVFAMICNGHATGTPLKSGYVGPFAGKGLWDSSIDWPRRGY